MSTTYVAAKGVWPQLRNGARKQATVIMAILFKEFRNRLGKSRTGLFWVLLEPFAHMFILSGLWYIARRTQIDGIHVMLFISSGITPYLIMRACISRIPNAIRTNLRLYDYQYVKPIDSLLANFIMEIILILVACSIMVFVLAWFFSIYADFPHILELISILAMMLCMGFGISLLVAVNGMLYESVNRVVQISTRPLIFISGVMYSVNDLPIAVRQALSWNPLLQFIEFIRVYALGTKPFPELDLEYVGLLSLAFLGVGMLSYYANRFRLIQQ